MSILNLIRAELLNSPSYVINEEKAKQQPHTTEFPCSTMTTDSIDLNFYPENQFKMRLQEQLAKRYQINPDQIVLTRGSDDGIDLVIRLFLRANVDAFMQFPPTFSMYAFYVRLQ